MSMCKNCGMENALETDLNCWHCKKPMANDSRSSACSAWVVSKVISQPFDTKEEAESFAETMKKGFTHKNDALIVTQNSMSTQDILEAIHALASDLAGTGYEGARELKETASEMLLAHPDVLP